MTERFTQDGCVAMILANRPAASATVMRSLRITRLRPERGSTARPRSNQMRTSLHVRGASCATAWTSAATCPSSVGGDDMRVLLRTDACVEDDESESAQGA